MRTLAHLFRQSLKCVTMYERVEYENTKTPHITTAEWIFDNPQQHHLPLPFPPSLRSKHFRATEEREEKNKTRRKLFLSNQIYILLMRPAGLAGKVVVRSFSLSVCEYVRTQDQKSNRSSLCGKVWMGRGQWKASNGKWEQKLGT